MFIRNTVILSLFYFDVRASTNELGTFPVFFFFFLKHSLIYYDYFLNVLLEFTIKAIWALLEGF